MLTSFPKELFEAYKQAFERMETEWDTAAKASYARAREFAEGAAAKIR